VISVLQGVAEANAFLFVLTPDSLASEVCAEELARAVERGKRIVPVVHRDVAGVRIPTELERPNWIWLRDEDDLERGLEQIIEAVETDLECPTNASTRRSRRRPTTSSRRRPRTWPSTRRRLTRR
jgi:hypothetical protein